MTGGPVASSEVGRLPGIDLLRIVAALWVLFFHYLYLFPANGRLPGALAADPVQGVAAHGYLGVELFFVISGFVITLSAEGRTRAEFAVARAIRLWPAFVLCA